MKKLFGLLLVVMAVSLLTGCGGSKELQMLWFNDGQEGVVMQEILDLYEEETGVKIELVEVPFGDYEARLATMIAGNESPALARLTEGHLNNFKAQILSLEDVYDSSKYTNLFFNADGDVISLPMDITANGLFVNLDLLDKYEVNYPALGEPVWTWDEFEVEMEKLLDKEDVEFPGIFDFQAHRFMPLMYQHGVKLWETPYTVSNLTSDAAVKALTRLVDLYNGNEERDALITQDVFAGSNSAALFRTGQYGFHMSGNWNVSAYQNLTFNWTVVPMPKDTNRATILGGKSMAAFKNSGAEQEALDFIEWLAEAEQHDLYTSGVPYLTPRLGAVVDYGVFTDEYSVFLDEIANTSAVYVQDWLNQVMIPGMYPQINEAIRKAANKEVTPLEALEALEAWLKNEMSN